MLLLKERVVNKSDVVRHAAIASRNLFSFKKQTHFKNQNKKNIMKLKKTSCIDAEMSIQKRNHIPVLKAFISIMVIMVAILFTNSVFGQTKTDTTTSVYSASENTYNQMLDYSRPGRYHQLLADLVGTWTSKGRHFNWIDSATSEVALEFSATVIRESFANGRYFIVEVISDGTLEMPIQEGKMKEVKYQGLEIEGYDNVKNKFQKTTIGNHLNSSILAYEGTYDSISKTITFSSEIEVIPGLTIKDNFLFIFIDDNHYKWEYYQEENGKFRLGTEINFTRVTGK